MASLNAKRRRMNTDTDTDTDTDTEKQDNKSESSPNKTDNDDPTISDEDELRETLLASCRLRHGLNADCLCEIFEFLEVYDLIQLCDLDIYFQNLIQKWVIGKKLINFTKMDPCWTTNKIFQTFGKNMHRIKIGDENTLGSFEHFLNFVIKYCKEGGLTEVDLRFTTPVASETIMEQSMPYFSNIRKLILNDNYSRVSYEDFLAGISTTANQLTHLTLEGVNVTGKWLINGGMESLKEFRMNSSKGRGMSINVNELNRFLQTKPNLELFSFVGRDDITPVVEALTDLCPKLKTFVDFQLRNNYDRSTHISTVMKNRYNFIRKFKSVTTLGLTSFTQCGSDIYYPLIKMAAQNRIETLKIYVNQNNANILSEENRMHYSIKEFDNFTKLKSIELQIKSDSPSESDLNAEFICEFISKMINIEKFTVMTEPSIWNVNKVIDMAPHLNEMNISYLKVKYLPVEMRKIIKSIRKRYTQLTLNSQEDPQPFHLIVNEQQWRELRVYKDADRMLKMSIENTDRNHSFKVHGA